MKEQYVGDINDYRKYAILRVLSRGENIRLGVCWMLTPSDTGPDGRKTQYLSSDSSRQFDPELYDLLRTIVDEPDRRRLVLIEESDILPNVLYYNAKVPDPLVARKQWFGAALSTLAPANTIFFDPDNGIEVRSKPKGAANSSKYVYWGEVAAAYALGHSLLIYQHFPRVKRDVFLADVDEGLNQLCPGSARWALTTANVAFLLIVRPEHQKSVQPLISEAATNWQGIIDVQSF